MEAKAKRLAKRLKKGFFPMTVTERFLQYVKIDTQSQPDCEAVPSTEKQHSLAKLLTEQLAGMGAKDVVYDKEHCYVYAAIPASAGYEDVPPLGLIAHMDTSDAVSGANVSPRIIQNYAGGDIRLNDEYTLRTAEFPQVEQYIGEDLIVTDGTTLLGADDKAGIAEIMALAQDLLTGPAVPHGEIRIAFTPDEEVGNGVKYFDYARFGAKAAYTVDGGEVGEIGYETFNAASCRLTIRGVSTHPGSSKGKMKNALLLGMEFQQMLPQFENPAYTEEREGFYHLCSMNGDVDTAVMEYILRDHDRAKLAEKRARIEKICAYLNERYGAGTFCAELCDAYSNMREIIEQHPYLIENAEAAMRRCGVEPHCAVVRGGTDGAVLSFHGVPCPNLCTGGQNCHGRFEFISVQSLQKVTDILKELVRIHAGA